MSASAPAMVTRLDGPPMEQQLAVDMVRRAVPFVPVVLIVAGFGWGANGVASAGYALALVLANFVLSAALLSWSARVSLGLLMGVALFGFFIRLGLIGLAVFLVSDAGWVEAMPLGLTLVVAHLGLLFWEVRFVSASLAFPGLKPASAKE